MGDTQATVISPVALAADSRRSFSLWRVQPHGDKHISRTTNKSSVRVFDTRRVAEEGVVERDNALEAARAEWNQHQAKLVANVSTSTTTYFVVVSNIRVGDIHSETAQHF